MRADVARVDRGGDQAAERLGRHAVIPRDGPLILLLHQVKELSEHAEGKELNSGPDRELPAVFLVVMAHEGQSALALDLGFELAHERLVRGGAVGELFVGEVFRLHKAQRAVGHREMVGDLRAQLHLEELEHGQQQVAQAHVELVERVKRIERYARQEALGVVRAAQVLAVGGQAVVVDRGEDAPGLLRIRNGEAMRIHQAGGLFLVAARRLDGRVNLLFRHRASQNTSQRGMIAAKRRRVKG